MECNLSKKIFFLCGELSAEQYVGEIAPVLLGEGHKVYAMGGRLLREKGVEVLADYSGLSVVGLSEVIEHYSELKQTFDNLVRKIKEIKPDILVCVDFPDFNVRVAKKVKNYVGKLVYFIPPQVWAWRLYRAKFLSNLFDKIIVLFPFEKSLFENGFFYGHPITEMIKVKLSEGDFEEKYGLSKDKKRIILLPGSRKREIVSLSPYLSDFANSFFEKGYNADFLYLAPRGMDKETVEFFKTEFEKKTGRTLVNVDFSDKYEAIKYSDLALGSSGTVSLECGLLGTPMVALYKLSNFTYFFGLCVVRTDFITLPNLVLEERVFEELVNFDITADNIMDYALKVLYNAEFGKSIEKRLAALHEKLSGERVILSIAKGILN